jgi:hypothetical protein
MFEEIRGHVVIAVAILLAGIFVAQAVKTNPVREARARIEICQEARANVKSWGRLATIAERENDLDARTTYRRIRAEAILDARALQCDI